MNASIGKFQTELLPLEAIRILATRFGYDDVDFEPTDAGFSLTVTGANVYPVTVKGRTEMQILTKLIDKLGK